MLFEKLKTKKTNEKKYECEIEQIQELEGKARKSGGMGWMCVNGTASCDDGSKGKCVKTAGQPATCQKNVMAGTPPSCGTRPDC